MLEILRKSWAFVFLLLIFVLLAALVFWPALARPLGAAVLVLSIVVTVLFTIQNHWQHRQAGGGKQFALNLALDLLGLGLTIGAAMYAGQLAGAYVGLRAGLWAGLVAGLACGFLAAWGVRFAWSACQFWGAEREKIGLSENHTGGSPDGEQGSETSPAFSQSSQSD